MEYPEHVHSWAILLISHSLRKPAALIFPAVLTDTPKLADLCAPRCGVPLTNAAPTFHSATRRPLLCKPVHAPLQSALSPAELLQLVQTQARRDPMFVSHGELHAPL